MSQTGTCNFDLIFSVPRPPISSFSGSLSSPILPRIPRLTTIGTWAITSVHQNGTHLHHGYGALSTIALAQQAPGTHKDIVIRGFGFGQCAFAASLDKIILPVTSFECQMVQTPCIDVSTEYFFQPLYPLNVATTCCFYLHCKDASTKYYLFQAR